MSKSGRWHFGWRFFIDNGWWLLGVIVLGYLAYLGLIWLRDELHVVRLRSLGAERVAYGPKAGWWVDLPPGIDPTEFLQKGVGSLDYLSRQDRLTLKMDGTGAEDSDTHYLKKIHGPLVVRLRDTKVSDQGVSQLIEMENLKYLDVSNSKVSEEGIQEFRLKRNFFPPP